MSHRLFRNLCFCFDFVLLLQVQSDQEVRKLLPGCVNLKYGVAWSPGPWHRSPPLHTYVPASPLREPRQPLPSNSENERAVELGLGVASMNQTGRSSSMFRGSWAVLPEFPADGPRHSSDHVLHAVGGMESRLFVGFSSGTVTCPSQVQLSCFLAASKCVTWAPSLSQLCSSCPASFLDPGKPAKAWKHRGIQPKSGKLYHAKMKLV